MSNRKRIFFTADWHVNHKNVLDFSNRPFTDVDHMHRVLINNYNSVMTENSVCYFLGDVGLAGSDIMTKVFRQLKGTKCLILGNHDKKHNAMYNIGFDLVLNAAKLYISGEPVTMSHCPLLGLYREDTSNMNGTSSFENWHGESRESRKPFTLQDEGQYHLHGHIHSPNNGKSVKELKKQFDVGVDANNYRLVSISEIESWIARHKRSVT